MNEPRKLKRPDRYVIDPKAISVRAVAAAIDRGEAELATIIKRMEAELRGLKK